MNVDVKDVEGIEIRGRCFSEEKRFVFFPTKHRLSLVYGKNGSGKTTCANGFKCCSSNFNDVRNLEACLVKKEDNKKLITPENGWGNICVFDEDYVAKNVRINESGLGAIVLFGEQGEIDEQIKEAEEILEDNQTLLKDCEERYNALMSGTCKGSLKFIREEIESRLKKDGAWADKDRELRGNRSKTRVDDTLFQELRSLSVTKELEVLQAEFQQKNDLYAHIQMGIHNYPTEIPQISISKDVENDIVDALSRIIERPELSERDKKIFEILTSPKNHRDEIVAHLSNGLDLCPYCFQQVSNEYRLALLKNLSTIFNEDANQFKSHVEQLKISRIMQDYSQFISLNGELVKQIQLAIQGCNSIIDQYNQYLSQKIENVFEPINIACLGLGKEIERLNSYIVALESKRQEVMYARSKKDRLKNELLSLNKMIYRKITEELFHEYENANDELNRVKDEKAAFSEEIRSSELTLHSLRQKKENIFIAIDRINRDLEYVFFSKTRIVLEPRNGYYTLKIDGKDVKPSDVSTGERNAIALCYFFTESFRQRDVRNLYLKDMLLVIDDPVSSYDIGNRIGIISYLKYAILRLVMENENSKILVFSHDIVTVWDLEKAFDEIRKQEKSITFGVFELDKFSLYRLQSDKKNEYSTLIKQTYNFAMNKNGDPGIIGNVMRRMLEAFSTFLYRMGIDEISYSPQLIEKFGKKSNYFMCLMYRLTLHGESHSMDATRACYDLGLTFHYTTDDEKQKIARGIISMMYLLQKEHILRHLKDEKNVQEVIGQWLEELPEN